MYFMDSTLKELRKTAKAKSESEKLVCWQSGTMALRNKIRYYTLEISS